MVILIFVLIPDAETKTYRKVETGFISVRFPDRHKKHAKTKNTTFSILVY